MASYKILLVDDDQNLRMSLSTVFTSLGFTVFEAPDGKSGVDIANEQKPDAIILDIKMPVMDGLTALSYLKKNPTLQQIPVFMLTNAQDEISHAVENGAEEGILKTTINPTQMATALINFLRACSKSFQQ